MKLVVQKKIVSSALWRMEQKRRDDFVIDELLRSYTKSTRMCGMAFDPSRPWQKHRCNRVTCQSCGRHAAKVLVNRYLSHAQDLDIDNYRMVTIMFDLQPTVKECLEAFSSDRTRIYKSVDKARRLKKDPLLKEQWCKFSIAGFLEIDLFYKDQFDQLGSRKQKSYSDDFEFDERAWIGENVYVPHAHCIAYLGDLPEQQLRDRLKKFSNVVHIQDLVDDKALDQSATEIIGYSSKAWFKTTLKDNKEKLWKPTEVEEYINCFAGKQGRKPIRLYKGEHGMRETGGL